MDIVIACKRCNEDQHFKVSDKQYADLKNNKKSIQEIFPEMKLSDREMFLSGLCEKCWNNIFSFAERRGGDIGSKKTSPKHNRKH